MEIKNNKILLVDKAHFSLEDDLKSIGYSLDYFPDYCKSDYENIAENYIGIIVRSKIIIDKKFINNCKNLKFIGRVGAGMENIDVEYAESLGIKCLNSPEGNRDALGEHTVGMLLCLFNNICRANLQVKSGIWEREANRGIEIKGKTIGIIGYGNMGGAFAKRLNRFDVNVIAYDKYKTNYSSEYVKETDMKEIFKNTDILSFHVPLTDETTYLCNNNFINMFQKNIFIINTSRGKVLNTDDLVKNMKSGKVLGAVLDVLEYEDITVDGLSKFNDSETFKYLANSDKCILTPHIAGWTIESNVKLSKYLVEKIKKLDLL